MKAKEYAELLFKDELEPVDLLLDFVEKAVIASQGSTSSSIFREHEQKWIALCKIVNAKSSGYTLRQDAFRIAISKYSPKDYENWMLDSQRRILPQG